MYWDKIDAQISVHLFMCIHLSINRYTGVGWIYVYYLDSYMHPFFFYCPYTYPIHADLSVCTVCVRMLHLT